MNDEKMSKTPDDSYTEMSELVLPNDTEWYGNFKGRLIGGRLMHWMDIAAAIVSRKHCNRACVTVSVDQLSFTRPIYLGEIVHLQAVMTRTFKTSMEIYIIVTSISITGEKRICNEAYFTFVTIDEKGRPIPILPLVPQTDIQKKRYAEALERREARLKNKI